jgi:hypothetical protein
MAYKKAINGNGWDVNKHINISCIDEAASSHLLNYSPDYHILYMISLPRGGEACDAQDT